MSSGQSNYQAVSSDDWCIDLSDGSDSEVAGAGEFANVLTKWTAQLVMAGGGEVDDEEDTDDSVIGVQEFVWESLLPLK
jgi:hypothetical protein